MVKVSRANDQRVFASQCVVANSLWSRFKGLMGQDRLDQGSGLLLEPCNSIHTFFMKFEIDVVYLDPQYKVIKVCSQTKPWRMHFPVFGARAVLELPKGESAGLNTGDHLCLS